MSVDTEGEGSAYTQFLTNFLFVSHSPIIHTQIVFLEIVAG